MINESMLLSIFYYCLMQNVNYGEAFLYFYNITNNVLVNYVDKCKLGNYYNSSLKIRQA